MTTLRISALAALLVALIAVPVFAQPVLPAKAGIIGYVEGKVLLADQVVEPSLTKFPDIPENAVVRTEEGRVEVLLSPGVVLHVGENSSFRMLTKRLIDTRLELLTGAAMVDATEIAKDSGVTVVVKDATVALTRAGHYRFDVEPARLKVFAGIADVQIAGQHIEVTGGKMLNFSPSAAAEKFDKFDTDSLDNWARRRSEVMALANASAAKRIHGGSGYGYGTGYSTRGQWSWNPYFGLYTFIPGNGRICDPMYGYCYWSPGAVQQLYYQPPPSLAHGGFLDTMPRYPTMSGTPSGYSGTMSAGSSGAVSAPAPAAAASSGASSAGSAAGASAGHGAGGGGGRGH